MSDSDSVRLPRWALRLGEALLPALLALIAMWVRVSLTEHEVAQLVGQHRETCGRVAVLETLQAGQRRDHDVLRAEILTELKQLRRDIAELKEKTP